jgi:DNA-binding transcriptional LysR family regulator
LLQHVSAPHAWPAWCERHGVRGINAHAGLQLDQYHSLIRAVAAGMGLALVPGCLVQEDVAAGLVCAPLDERYEDDLGYWLCFPEPRAHLPALIDFRQWLLAQVSSGPRASSR